jgi:hypothetical protein
MEAIGVMSPGSRNYHRLKGIGTRSFIITLTKTSQGVMTQV